MRRRVLGVLLLLCMIVPAGAAPQGTGPRVKDSVVGIDKLKHFLLSGFVESVAFAGLQAAGVNRDASLAGAGTVTAVVALGREVHDRRVTGLFSFGDLLWDALGAGAAMLLLSRIGR